MNKQGFYFIEGMPRFGQRRPKPGLEEPQNWQPYEVWVADLWQYKGCGATILCSALAQARSPNIIAKILPKSSRGPKPTNSKSMTAERQSGNTNKALDEFNRDAQGPGSRWRNPRPVNGK
jgi:hypothetical protein